mgnify:CR=1 FL=1
MPIDYHQNKQLTGHQEHEDIVKVHLKNGIRMEGVIVGFDNFCIILKSDDTLNLIYKHSISTIQRID